MMRMGIMPGWGGGTTKWMRYSMPAKARTARTMDQSGIMPRLSASRPRSEVLCDPESHLRVIACSGYQTWC